MIKSYKNALAYILPSLSENFGHTVVEALATSTPVFSSTNVDVITLPKIKGLVIPFQPNTADLTKSLLKHLPNIKKTKKKISKAPQIIVKLFSPQVIAKKMISYYKTLTSK